MMLKEEPASQVHLVWDLGGFVSLPLKEEVFYPAHGIQFGSKNASAMWLEALKNKIPTRFSCF